MQRKCACFPVFTIAILGLLLPVYPPSRPLNELTPSCAVCTDFALSVTDNNNLFTVQVEWGTSVGILPRIRDERSGNRGPIPGKGKSVPLQAWSGPEGSRKLRFPDFMTTAQDGGKVVSPTHRPPLPQEMLLVLISVRGWVDPRAIVGSEGFYVNEKSTDTTWDRTSDLPICSTAP